MVTFSTHIALRPMASRARASCSCRRFSGSTTTSEACATTTRPRATSCWRPACSTARSRGSSGATPPRRSTRAARSRPISAGTVRSWTSRPASTRSRARPRWGSWAIAGADRSPGLPRAVWSSTWRSAITAARSSSSSARRPTARRCSTSAPRTRASRWPTWTRSRPPTPTSRSTSIRAPATASTATTAPDYHADAAALARDRSLAHLARHLG